MKKFIIILSLCLVSIVTFCQNSVSDSSKWSAIPMVGVVGLKLQYVGGSAQFEQSAFNTMCMGMTFKHYTKGSSNHTSINGLVLFNGIFEKTSNVNLGLGITAGYTPNVLPVNSDISAGLSWDFNQKYPAILLNVTIGLN